MPSVQVTTAARVVRPAGLVGRVLEDHDALGVMMVTPALLILAIFLAYPFGLGVWLSFTNATIGQAGRFVGLGNFRYLLGDSVFRVVVLNTTLYAVAAVVCKLLLGFLLALLVNREFRGKRIVRAIMLLPWIVPTSLSALVFYWIYDPTFSIITWALRRIGLLHGFINYLGDPNLARASLIAANIWRGIPFFAIGLLAGLQTVSPTLYEAAAIDGAGPWQKFWFVTWPVLLPLTVVVTVFATHFAPWLQNTMLIALGATVLALSCAVFAAYAVQRLRFRGSGVIGVAIFLSYLVPPVILFIPLARIINELGLWDRPAALILTYPTFLIPFATWLLMGYFKSIPVELEDCARIDGATRVQVLRHILLPLALPGILSALIFSFTLSWNEYLYALVFLSSTGSKTIPVGLATELITGDVFQWGPLMAGALLGSVPVALIYSFFVEHYVAGLTGALKE